MFFMPAELASYCLNGLEASPIRLEVDVARGMPFFSVIGMVSTSVKEAKERVRSAIVHSGFKFPMNRKIVNLAPAELNKRGSHFDLPMAIGILIADGQMKPVPKNVLLIGELGLEGGIREVTGLLPGLMMAKAFGFKQVVLPNANLAEASLIEDLELIPVTHLQEVVGHFEGKRLKSDRLDLDFTCANNPWDFADISGHIAAKRTLLVAAAGGHHVLMSGSPGSGKTLLARAFPSILPPLSRNELLEVMRIYSVAGHGLDHKVLSRPFRMVHQSCSAYGLVGGGAHLMPGEVSLAHRGVLFMDEFPEFDRKAVESLRGPLENGNIVLRRGGRLSEYPCAFQLIAAMNPCPCGFFGDNLKTCTCPASAVNRYQSKISGPLLDRIDCHIEVPRVSFGELREGTVESSVRMQARVVEARERQRARLEKHGIKTNHEMSAKLVKAEKLDTDSQEILLKATNLHGLSGRAVFKLIKMARTIADLDGLDRIGSDHVMEALQYRLKS